VGQPLRLEWHSPRPFSAACVMLTASGPVIVKRHHARVRDVAALGEEHRFVAHLHAGGLPVSPALTTADGATALADEYWTLKYSRLAPGWTCTAEAMSWTPFSSSHHARSAGHMARLHLASPATMRRHARRVRWSSFTIFSQEDPVRPLQAYIEQRPAIADYLENRPWRGEVAHHLLPWHAGLKPYLDEFAPLWTHNDWHASNLLWSDATGHRYRRCWISACATAPVRCTTWPPPSSAIVEWLAIPQRQVQLVHLDLLDAMLDGYASLRR
jgi:Ser/Thr protein kinase RdoA (MazF antagonist)